jgi:hypothetical protein
MQLIYATSLEQLALATPGIEITYKSPEQPTFQVRYGMERKESHVNSRGIAYGIVQKSREQLCYGIALLLNRRRWKSATGWSIKSPKTNSDRTVAPKATGIPTAHRSTAFTLKDFYAKK